MVQVGDLTTASLYLHRPNGIRSGSEANQEIVKRPSTITLTFILLLSEHFLQDLSVLGSQRAEVISRGFIPTLHRTCQFFIFYRSLINLSSSYLHPYLCSSQIVSQFRLSAPIIT